MNQKTISMIILPLSTLYCIVGCVIATSLSLMVLSAGDIGYDVQYVDATISQTNNSSTISELIQNGNTFLNRSEYDKAMNTFDQVLTLDSGSVGALNGKGMVLNSLGKYKEAISWFDVALKIDPNFVETLNNKGISLSNLGKYKEAISWFDMALKIDPNFVAALYNKADALGELGNYEEAFIWTEKALAIDTARQNTSMSTNALLPNEIN
ncbi:MAG TPA: tetratricopeptide repeat protein [Nitrososphaeraceae archaeon]|nr:tetratricopeptide repeat protein [Nitrososphaeraceae archaeon]